MAEKISVQIALDGGKEVEQQLANIGEAGTTAFKEISPAADKATKSVSSFSLQTVKTSAEIAKLGLEITKLGVEIGLAVVRHKTLAQSLFQLATGANTAVRAIGLLAPELTAAAAVIAPFTLVVAGAAVAFEALEKAATAAAKGYAASTQSLQALATASGQSFNSLQKGKAGFAQLGFSAQAFDGIIRKVAETLAGANLGGELKKSADEADAALLKVRQAQDALFQSTTSDQLIAAQKLLADAYGKTGEAAANNIGKILEQVKALESGQKGVTFDSLTKGETIIKAVALSMQEAAAQGQIAGQVLVNFIANADKLTAIKVGAGFGITEADVTRIQTLGGQLGVVDAVWKRIQGAGVLIPPESVAAFDRLQVKMAEVDSAAERLQQALSSSVFATEAAKISGDLNTIKAGLLNFAAATVETFNSALSGLSTMFANTRREFETLGAALTAVGAALVQVFTSPKAALDALIAGVQTLITKLMQFLGLVPSGGAPAAAGNIPGKAGGGLLGGRGTGTSDSNLAWVSRGEHIMPARAVQQPGVLAFLEALRRSGGNLSRVLNGMGRFALGGMVPRTIPAYAAGGLAGGGNHVTIQFPGLPSIGGLRASSSVVGELQKAAALAQVRSGGRKPSRYS